MVPDVQGDDRGGRDRVVEARGRPGLALLEVGDELAAGGVDAQEVVDVGGCRLGLGPALGDERDRVVMPPVPVLVPTPAPVRLNHSSTVNVALRSWLVLPRVAYWVVPLSWRACWPAAKTATGATVMSKLVTSARVTPSMLPRITASLRRGTNAEEHVEPPSAANGSLV